MAFATKSVDYGIPFTQLIDNIGGLSTTEPVYIGEAEPGTLQTAGTAKWRIKKISYDAGTNNPAKIEWASGTTNFDKDWTLRATYTYK